MLALTVIIHISKKQEDWELERGIALLSLSFGGFMRSKLIIGVCTLFLIIIAFSVANVKAEMLPLADSTLANVSAKGIDIKMFIYNTVKVGLLQNGSFSGEIGGTPIKISTGSADDMNKNTPFTQTSLNTIRLSGQAQQNLSAFNNFNAVNSAVNVGVNLIVIVNSTINKLSPVQTNWGVNFANSQILFNK